LLKLVFLKSLLSIRIGKNGFGGIPIKEEMLVSKLEMRKLLPALQWQMFVIRQWS
jgi:hypothetical protein